MQEGVKNGDIYQEYHETNRVFLLPNGLAAQLFTEGADTCKIHIMVLFLYGLARTVELLTSVLTRLKRG